MGAMQLRLQWWIAPACLRTTLTWPADSVLWRKKMLFAKFTWLLKSVLLLESNNFTAVSVATNQVVLILGNVGVVFISSVLAFAWLTRNYSLALTCYQKLRQRQSQLLTYQCELPEPNLNLMQLFQLLRETITICFTIFLLTSSAQNFSIKNLGLIAQCTYRYN